MSRHPSHAYFDKSKYYSKYLLDHKFVKKYFTEAHFIIFEAGYTPLTLLAAKFEDFRMARRRYLAISHVIQFSS